jgi:hypothetical protein
MVQPNDPADPKLWQAYARVERATIARSALNVFTTAGTLELYRERYPERSADHFAVVENGYDEDVFSALPEPPARPAGRLLLLHSGAIYPLERDPTQLFLALARLRTEGALSAQSLCVRLRATGHDAEIAKMIAHADVGDLVELAPPVPYRAAVAEMVGADGLLILQAGQVKTQVPAKVYEYVRAGRPILALTDPRGDTARVLAAAGVRHLAPIDSSEAIAAALGAFLGGIRANAAPTPDPDWVRRASRRNRTRELAALLDGVVESRSSRIAAGLRALV